jgi:hypothetical protein
MRDAAFVIAWLEYEVQHGCARLGKQDMLDLLLAIRGNIPDDHIAPPVLRRAAEIRAEMASGEVTNEDADEYTFAAKEPA